MESKTNIIGIGIGPFNLGLAALLSTHDDLASVFLERNSEFHWHPGLLLPGTTLQVPFFADLVTMADPSHKLSYLNYLSQHDRLYQFYYYENFQIPRVEYNHYCRWAANQLPNCNFGENVTEVSYNQQDDTFTIYSELTASGQKKQYTSPNIAIGIGTKPNIPKWLAECRHPLVKHASEFFYLQEKLTQCQNVTVIGSGQSAAECVLALFRSLTPEQIKNGASIRWITQSAGYHPMEYSKLGQECFTPSYMNYFQDLSREQRRKIAAGQGLLFKGISCSTIAEIYDLLYERSTGGQYPGLSLNPNCQVNSIEETDLLSKVTIKCKHTQLGKTFSLEADAVIAGVGYVHEWPTWLEHLKGSVLAVDDNNDFIVEKNFTAQRCDKGLGKIFIQNAEIFQQSVASPDLGVGACRNSVIINQLAQREVYRPHKNTSFQQYGIPEGAILDS